MPDEGKEPVNPLFNHPLESSPGLTIDDLNRYLSAVRKSDEISMTIDSMEEGVFLSDALDGLKRLPDESIDLILTAPPESPWREIGSHGERMTIQEYYQWSHRWIKASQRVIKKTGSIYLLCGWRYSGMYHSLLSDYFRIQTRITWRNRKIRGKNQSKTWYNEIGDIWFATKTNSYIFHPDDHERESELIDYHPSEKYSNVWMEYYYSEKDEGKNDYPDMLLKKILEASTYKLNWVTDPFMRRGSVGISVKQLGRRFIGFETDKDSLLLAMKRIDHA